MRNVIKADSLTFGANELKQFFAPIAQELEMKFEVIDSEVKKKVIRERERSLYVEYISLN